VDLLSPRGVVIEDALMLIHPISARNKIELSIALSSLITARIALHNSLEDTEVFNERMLITWLQMKTVRGSDFSFSCELSGLCVPRMERTQRDNAQYR
jgi:hypothetical protein